MRCTQPRRQRGVAALLDRSARFLSGLFSAAPLPPQPSLRASFSFPRDKSFCGEGEGHRGLAQFFHDAAAAHFLLSAKPHATELRASLVAAFFPKPHCNNSVTHAVDGQSLASLEKDVTDTAAALLCLPSRFLWSPWARDGDGAFAEMTSSNRRLATSLGGLPAPQAHVPQGAELFSGGGGGGLLHNSSLESLLVVLTTARAQAHSRYISARFSSPEDEARVTQRLVLYCSDQCQPLLRRAARCVGIRHIRVLQTVYSPFVHNYPIQLSMLKTAIAEDAAHGLYPLLVCGVFGARTTGAVDPLDEMGELCRRLKLWFHIDASHSGLALASTASQGGEAGQCLSPGFGEEEDSAFETMWERQMLIFQKAALHADSIHFGLSTSFLPTFSSNSPASLLYLADVAKATVTMQRMNVDEDRGGNMWCTPEVTDMALTRLDNPEMRSNEILRLALLLMQCHRVSLSCAVRRHQKILHYLAQRLRADGRFDCAVDASCFGIVLFRWLTLADEETAALMRRWSDAYAAAHAAGDAAGNLPCVSLGLTKVQRRMYICVGLAAGRTENGGDDDHGGDGCLDRRDVDVLMGLLKTVASEWDVISMGQTSGNNDNSLAME